MSRNSTASSKRARKNGGQRQVEMAVYTFTQLSLTLGSALYYHDRRLRLVSNQTSVKYCFRIWLYWFDRLRHIRTRGYLDDPRPAAA